MAKNPSVSIVVPVYNGGEGFIDCLFAINQYRPSDWELIVVDDGSTDNSGDVARQFGARVLKTAGRQGPGGARNLGTQHARGDYVAFIDADCEVNAATLANIAQTISDYPELDAFFGSYDDQPRAKNFVAQYKNLMHRYVHQTGNEEAFSFWAGCGVVRRSAFLELGGFDVNTYGRPSIEDIDLGYRIRQAGGSIRVAKSVQVKHFKAWSLTNLVKVDIFDRGIPWTRLILRSKKMPNDLNLQSTQRLCVALSFLLLPSLLLSFIWPVCALVSPVIVSALVALNWDVYKFFYKNRGFVFALKVLPMQWLYFMYGGVSFILGTALHWRDRITGKPHPTPPDPLPCLRNVASLQMAGRN
jgi:glycosyltransferase involved in cell wall biosynthesis